MWNWIIFVLAVLGAWLGFGLAIGMVLGKIFNKRHVDYEVLGKDQ